jgi:hypothetical protein
MIEFLITIIAAFLTYCLIVLNEHKDEIWEEIHKRLK